MVKGGLAVPLTGLYSSFKDPRNIVWLFSYQLALKHHTDTNKESGQKVLANLSKFERNPKNPK